MENSVEIRLTVSLRRRRAEVLVFGIMRELDGHIYEEDRRVVSDKLMKLFHDEGVEILTDYERQAAGLPPRGPEGWTEEELVALERSRLEILSRPLLQIGIDASGKILP